MLDLNTLIAPGLGVTLNQATAINNGGQIVANGFGHPYLLTPIAAPVPEPSTLPLFGVILFALSTCVRRNYNKRQQSGTERIQLHSDHL